MREILLRSYDEELESFYYFFNGKYYSNKELKVEMYPEVFNWSNAEYSAGVLDKNGNKIFEGDLVKAFGRSSYQVVYNDGAFYLRKENSHLRLSRTIQDLEIIGNIHEEN